VRLLIYNLFLKNNIISQLADSCIFFVIFCAIRHIFFWLPIFTSKSFELLVGSMAGNALAIEHSKCQFLIFGAINERY
jgi:hypothetical protein